MNLGRRELLIAATAATGGLVYSRGLSAMLAKESPGHNHSSMLMSEWDAYVDQPVDAFAAEKRKQVSAMAETIIPRTDTPGAIDAKVPKFIELLYEQWMAEPEKTLFDGGLKQLDSLANQLHGKAFADCGADAQKTVLEQLEEQQGDHSWFGFGGDFGGRCSGRHSLHGTVQGNHGRRLLHVGSRRAGSAPLRNDARPIRWRHQPGL